MSGGYFNPGGDSRSGGYSGGYGSPAATEQPDPALVADAVTAVHEATSSKPLDTPPAGLVAALQPPGKGHREKLRRWDPWVHSLLMVPQLMEQLTFHPTNASLEIRVGRTSALILCTPDLKTLAEELQVVRRLAKHRRERRSEILVQATDTSPFWTSILPLGAERPATISLLNVAYDFARTVVMRCKHEFAVWRPSEMSGQIKPMIPNPRHGAYPMGHACEAVVTASLLRWLIAGKRGSPHNSEIDQQLQLVAARIGWNRVIAGLHYPSDYQAGAMLGAWLSQYIAVHCGDASYMEVKRKVIDPATFANVTGSTVQFATDAIAATEQSKIKLPQETALQALARDARAEWSR